MAEAWQASPYANETYLQSLGRSSADVRRQVGNALSEIGRQRQVAMAQAAQIPGATNAAFQGGASALGSDLQALGMPGAAPDAMSRFFTTGAKSYRRAAELLGHGFQEQARQRSGMANQLQQTLLSEIAGRAQDYIGRRDEENRQREWVEAEEIRRHNLQVALQNQQAQMHAQALAEQARQADLNRQHQTTLTQMMYPTQYPGPARTSRPSRRPMRGAF